MNLSFRHYYWRWTKNLFFLMLFMAIVMTMARAFFVTNFGDWSGLLQNPALLKHAFFLGLRFDLIPLAYIHILPFIVLNVFYFIPGRSSVLFTRFFLISFLAIGYYALIWLYIFDYAFYSYFQDHLNILFFGFFEDDTIAVLVSVWKNYNLLLWIPIVLFFHYAFYRFLKLLFSPFDFDLKAKKTPYKVPFILLLGLTGLVFLARGNFSRLPLSLEDSHISSQEFINEIPLNGVITFNRAMKIRKVFGKGSFNYQAQFGYADWQTAFRDAFHREPQGATIKASLMVKTSPKPHTPPHVVMIVMESFGTFWNDQNSAEFDILGDLKPYFKSGYYFKNFLSAENGTIGSMMSVATSTPIRPGARFLNESEFLKDSLSSSSEKPFKAAGYETHFVYGGKLGWRDLGAYLNIQGYDRLWGADEMKEGMPELNHFEAKDLGNEWGIYDEYLYSFIEDRLRTATTPQFFLVLTTSNHPPFEHPSSYRPLPLKMDREFLSKLTVDPDLARKRFESLQYANQKTGEFLNRIEKSILKDNVLVALTGDHSFWIAKNVEHADEFRRYAVPFLIVAPSELQNRTYNPLQFGSHEDIFPTLYDLALSNQSYVGIGQSLFSKDTYALNSSGLVANEKGAYHHAQFWKWKDLEKQILEPTAETPELLKLKKHAEGLITITDLYLKEENASKLPGAKSDPQK
jgi:phosphoglycerol transferase MdoB-like AlkP superfamily enzyme